MEHADNITVEVAYALPHRQLILELSVAPGTTMGQAIRASGILERFPEIDLTRNKVGVFGKPETLDTVLQDGDRAEIYRPLIADPKEVRKRRAARGKVTKKGGGR